MKTQLFSDDALSVMKEACILVVASLEINQMDGATFCKANLFYFQVEDSHRDKRNVTLVNSWTTQKYQKKRENKREKHYYGKNPTIWTPPPRPPKSLVIKVGRIDGGKELDGGGRMTFFFHLEESPRALEESPRARGYKTLHGVATSFRFLSFHRSAPKTNFEWNSLPFYCYLLNC